MKWSEADERTKYGLATEIARRLREFGYKSVRPNYVLDELEKAPENRTIIGMLAARMLADNDAEVE